ncbi:four helix bundle protein [bacterium]|nr:four helix bundle protein [bacterium]
MSFMFEKLEVYQKAVDVAEKTSKLTDTFPKGNYYLIDQLNRAALSISANLAEGNGRWHPKERKQFFWIARGSAQECIPIIEVCKRKQLINSDNCLDLNENLNEICKMINGLVRGLDKKEAGK